MHLEGKLSSSDFYNQDKNKIQSTLEEFTELTNRIEEKIEAGFSTIKMKIGKQRTPIK